jgi:fibronectin type 3 domain-containing protein
VGFDVVFDPTVAGADTGSLTFSGNSNTISEPLGGTGVQPTYSVNLSWNASSSVVGYNVYRGIMPGTYSKINSALDPNTAYTDSTVVAGTTYYYAATSVNSSGQESTYSPPVEIAVP